MNKKGRKTTKITSILEEKPKKSTEIDKIIERFNTLFPYMIEGGFQVRGKQESTYIRRLTWDEKEMVELFDFVVFGQEGTK